VVLRQLVAFQDNVELIGRLDAALLDCAGTRRAARTGRTATGYRLANRTAFNNDVRTALATAGDPPGRRCC
jgi:hypothetical protein